MTRLHFLMRENGIGKREARKTLRALAMFIHGHAGSKTIAKIHKAERVRHCVLTIPVRDGEPF